MAKIVIAGRSDCPYFARVELLGDRLAKNLKKFKLHKIMVQPDQWDKWLKDTCNEKGWSYNKSPIVWRELIDRGGKGVLIGGANEFQEYIKAYYDIESEMNSYDMRTISAENKITKDELDEEERAFKALSHPVHVCITNASSPICYHLLNTISSGQVLGPNIELTIRLLISQQSEMPSVKGMAMETEDLAHGLLKQVTVFTSAKDAFEDCSVVILLDDLIQNKDESTRDWLVRNEEAFSKYAKLINDKALKTCKVMVCGKGPLNFNATVVHKNAPDISRQNIVAVSSVVENLGKSVIGERLHVNPAGVVSLVLWGNINGKRHFDVSSSRVHNYDGAVWGPPWYSVSAVEMIHNNRWILKELPELVNARNVKVAEAMGRATGLSTANAISATLQYWCRGSPHKQVFSLGVYSEGWYGVPEGLFFSYPVTMDPKGHWHVSQDFPVTEETKEAILESVKDIQEQLAKAKEDAVPGVTEVPAEEACEKEAEELPLDETTEKSEEGPVTETAETKEGAAEPVEETSEKKEGAAEPAEETSEKKEGDAAPVEETSEKKEGDAAPVEETSEKKEGDAEPAEEVSEKKDGEPDEEATEKKEGETDPV